MRAVLGFVVVLLMWPIATAQDAEHHFVPGGFPPVRRALLIGINDYLANDLPPDRTAGWIPPDLNGAVNDVEMLRAVLVSRFGFESENVEVLTDTNATREAILRSLKKFVADAGPRDVVYFHFSGHGSQVEDLDGDEAGDEMDETLLPHDARTEGIPDITDDELGAVLSGLHVASALIVLDSCHSGTATRGKSSLRTRYVPPDPRSSLYPKVGERGKRSASLEGDYVLLTGAAEHQSALDGPLDGGRFYGFFSFALGKSLGRASRGANAHDIHGDVQDEFGRMAATFGIASMPEPQLEGREELAQRPVLTAVDASPEKANAARLPWVEVLPVSLNEVTLVQGSALGAVEGSLWAIYPPSERQFAPGSALGIAEVTSARGEDATATLKPRGASVPASGRAVLLVTPSRPETPGVYLDGVEPELRRQLESALLDGFVPVEVLPTAANAKLIVDVSEGTCRVHGPGGLQEIASFPMSTPAEVAARLGTLAARSVKVADLLLENRASRIRVAVRVLPADEHGNLRSAPVRGAADVPAYRVRGPGEPRTRSNSLLLEITPSEDSYISVVVVDSEGSIANIFPNPASEKLRYHAGGLIPSGQTVRIPDSLDEPNRAGFHVDFAYPLGLDTVHVFAASDVETAEMIRAYLKQVANDARTRGGDSDPERAFARDLTMRGVRVVLDESEESQVVESSRPTSPSRDWAVATRTFLVEAADD